MNTLIVLACALATVAATSSGYNVKIHHPHGHSSISNGAHLSHNGYALNGYANNGYANNGYANNGYANNDYAHNGYAYNGYSNNGYPTQHRQIDPVAIAAGAPLPYGDAPDVAAAKHAHLHAHAAAIARHHAAAVTALPADDHHYSQESHNAVAYNGYAHGYAHIAEPRIVVDAVAIHAGAPLPVGDTAEVVHAKALHFQAHAARGNLIRYRRGVQAVAYNAPLVHAEHVIGHKSVFNAPLFTAAHQSGRYAHGVGHATSHTSVTIGGHAYHY